MSLPTPPATSHRDKENRPPNRPSNHVAWSPYNQFHTLTKGSPPKLPAPSGVPQKLPTKSILKKQMHILTPYEPENKRSNTPEPSDPLTDLKYLEYPVSKIISPDSSLRDVTEGYFMLAARLRNTVPGTTDADASWPLFQPLRKNRDMVMNAIIRDLGRALVDPLQSKETMKAEICVALPSPKSTPSKKQGMTAEQVKHARDLCTTCQSVIKFLMTIFILPAVYKVFSDEQLTTILNRVLDITLTPALPTPNARKTYALTISCLQVQRLPSQVLVPTAHRIAFAINRGIEGELGKEGKKGSIADGLKAIQELAMYQPSTFVPEFIKATPAILTCLGSRNMQIRMQACLALRGLAIGIYRSSNFWARLDFSRALATTFTARPLLAENIDQVLRVALSATDPSLTAQGPVWGLCVLANMIFIMGPFLGTNLEAQKAISSLLSIAMQHRKSSVRALGCLVWRFLTWAYVQHIQSYKIPVEARQKDLLPFVLSAGNIKTWKENREQLWKIVMSVVEMGAGVATVVSLLHRDNEPENVGRALILIKIMIEKGGQTCGDAMDLVHRLVNPRPKPAFDPSQLLLPLAHAMPGLLEAGYGSLVSAVRPIFQKCPQVDGVRSFTLQELGTDRIFEELIDIWFLGLANLELSQNDEMPLEIIEIWSGLLKANLEVLIGANNKSRLPQFVQRIVGIISQVLLDAKLDFTEASTQVPTSPAKSFQSSSGLQPKVHTQLRSNAALKLSLARSLWAAIRRCSHLQELQEVIAPELMAILIRHETTLIGGANPQEDAREMWARFCADVLVIGDLDAIWSFWKGKLADDGQRERNWTPTENSFVWRTFVTEWSKDLDIQWEVALQLLVIPFANATSWDFSDDDLLTWDGFLSYTINRASSLNVDSTIVLESVALVFSQKSCPPTCDSVRIADFIISHLELAEARRVPDAVLDFVNDALRSSYPPVPSNKVTCQWLIRSLTRLIDACPWALVDQFLEGVQEGLCLWISDEWMALTQEEYSYNIVPIYEIAVVSFQALPLAIFRLDNLSPLLESAFCGREDKPSSMRETFIEFWTATYTTMDPPSGWSSRIQNCLRASFAESGTVDSATSAPESCDADANSLLRGTTLDEKRLFELEEDSMLLEEYHTDSESEEEEIQPERPPLFDFARRKQAIDAEGKQVETSHPNSSPSTTPSPSKDVKLEVDAADHQLSLFNLSLGLEPPSTPVRKPQGHPITTTPPRPCKSSTIPKSLPPSPATPVLGSLPPNRSPLSFVGNWYNGESPSKQSSVEVEKILSSRASPSVAEPVINKSPGKRASPDEEQDQGVSKRRKGNKAIPVKPIPTEVTGILKEPPLPMVFDDIFAATPSSVEDVVDIPSPCIARKRKRTFMDCVEVPTLRQVRRQQRRAASFESLFTPSSQVLRRTRSAGKLSKTIELSEEHQNDQMRRRKRRRRSLPTSRPVDDSVLASLQEAAVPDSDDSVLNCQDPPSDPPQPEQLSDDDPYEGQVTPHHLISPALRRVRETETDPPSDDSIMSNSPTRDVAARQLKRRGQLSIDRIPPLT